MLMKRGLARSAPDPDSGDSPGVRRWSAPLLLLLSLTAGPGCYSYQPADLAGIEPGEQVRVALEETGYRRVAPGAAPEAQPRLEGDFVSATDDSVSLAIWIGEAYRGTPFEAAHQVFAVPRAAVVRIERRKLSKWRTAVTAAGVLATIAALIDGIGLVEIIDSGDDGVEPYPPAGPTGAVHPR